MSPLMLVSIQVGLPAAYGTPDAPDPMDQPWASGIVKRPVAGPVRLGRTNLAGDGQADTRNHGGLDKAVNVYSADHYAFWRAELGMPDLPHGAFGENFTLRGATETDVCVGDSFTVGDAVVQVTQPRQPCWKLARRWRRLDLAARVEETGFTGWYLRVLREGTVEAGMVVTLAERPHPEWTVARAYAVASQRPVDPVLAAELASCYGALGSHGARRVVARELP